MTQKEYLISAKKAIKNAGLYLATYDDIENFANIAANAYENYPLHNWLSNGKYDAYLSKKIMKISLKIMLKNGVIYSDTKTAKGFSIWLPPGFKGTNPFHFMISGGFSLFLHCGLHIFFKLLSYENFAMKLKNKYTDNTDWYLFNLSIKKEEQGKGLASKLLTPMLDFCNENSYSCYLETNSEKNVHIYQHFGFILKETTSIPKSIVNHFIMLKK